VIDVQKKKKSRYLLRTNTEHARNIATRSFISFFIKLRENYIVISQKKGRTTSS